MKFIKSFFKKPKLPYTDELFLFTLQVAFSGCVTAFILSFSVNGYTNETATILLFGLSSAVFAELLLIGRK